MTMGGRAIPEMVHKALRESGVEAGFCGPIQLTG